MKTLLIATALALVVGQARAQTLPRGAMDAEGAENMEHMDVIMAMADHVKQMPTQQRDQFVRAATGAMVYHKHCEKLPSKVRFAMLGTIMADPQLMVKEDKGINWMRESMGDAEFCQKFRPAIEQVKRDFSTVGL